MDDLIVKQNIVNRCMDTKEERGRVMNWELMRTHCSAQGIGTTQKAGGGDCISRGNCPANAGGADGCSVDHHGFLYGESDTLFLAEMAQKLGIARTLRSKAVIEAADQVAGTETAMKDFFHKVIH